MNFDVSAAQQLKNLESLASSGADSVLDEVSRVRNSGPVSAELEFEIGQLLERLGLKHEAVEAYWLSVNLGRCSANSFERLARLYESLGYCGRSLWYSAMAEKLNKCDSSARQLLARTQCRVGKLAAGLRTYRGAMNLCPADGPLHSNYLFALLHDAGQSPARLKQVNERWCSLHCPASTGRVSFYNFPNPHRKLRLAYLCAEFRQSPAYHVVPPLIEGHDRDHFEIYCYHLSEASDEITDEYRRSADHWRDVAACDPDQIKERILRDRIDVLVERSGHISRPLGIEVCQRRAAPVQVAHLNYPCTTGCREIDYLVSDRWTSPDEGRFSAQYSERIVYRVPSGCLVYRPQYDAPGVSPLPARRNGYVTFGLFQRPAKVNDGVWDAISTILKSTPGSRLLVQHGDRELAEPGSVASRRVLRALGRRGVAASRVEFVGAKDKCDYPGTIAEADIALDSFPYSGEITTCTCLWMGVPVVTLAGDRHSSRVSGSILSRIGLEDWVAASIEDYIVIATAKAAGLPALAKLRSGLRQRMSESSVCRPEIVVRELEEGYRWMWRQWCASQTKALALQAAAR
jgi:predicted O-linked N-acetylglucosamine transferase (SPINDLY family)